MVLPSSISDFLWRLLYWLDSTSIGGFSDHPRCVPGMSFVLWSRLTLGKNYFVSTGLGAQLFADHQLVKNGPFAIVRHPMYSGLILAAFGSVLIYMTWTTVILACFAPSLIFRALREEKALAEEFGSQWLDYCLKVPAFFPYLRKRR
jgi:protein-S-isoprenylcysteine O-methyltransferase Ste14